MSTLTKYARKVDQIAKAAFADYRKAEAAYNTALEQKNRYPQHNAFMGGEYATKSARAYADFLEAKDGMQAAKIAFERRKDDIQEIRKELAAALKEENSADPAQLDNATLELLKSGMLTAYDYLKILDAAQAAGNATMARLIGKYADNAASARAEKYGQNDPEARSLRLVSYQSQNTENEDLQAFDSMASLYSRCVVNPRMIDHWDELTEELTQGDADPAEPAGNN